MRATLHGCAGNPGRRGPADRVHHHAHRHRARDARADGGDHRRRRRGHEHVHHRHGDGRVRDHRELRGRREPRADRDDDGPRRRGDEHQVHLASAGVRLARGRGARAHEPLGAHAGNARLHAGAELLHRRLLPRLERRRLRRLQHDPRWDDQRRRVGSAPDRAGARLRRLRRGVVDEGRARRPDLHGQRHRHLRRREPDRVHRLRPRRQAARRRRRRRRAPARTEGDRRAALQAPAYRQPPELPAGALGLPPPVHARPPRRRLGAQVPRRRGSRRVLPAPAGRRASARTRTAAPRPTT